VRPFVRELTGTPTGPEGAVVPFGWGSNNATLRTSIAVDGGGDLWVPEGEDRLDEFGPSGAYEGALEPPSLSDLGAGAQIAINESTEGAFAGDLYVSHPSSEGFTKSPVVEIFSKNGDLKKSFGPVSDLASIAVDNSTDVLDPSAGDLYVNSSLSDATGEAALKKFNGAGEASDWEDFKGSKACDCSVAGNEIIFKVDRSGAEGVAVDPGDGDIWAIAQFGNGEGVIEFSPRGEVIGGISRESLSEEFGTLQDGELTGLAVDPTNGDLLVSLLNQHEAGEVEEFNSQGVFLGRITEVGGRPLVGAEGLAVDSHGDLYIVNHNLFSNEQGAVEEVGPGRYAPSLRPAAATVRVQSGPVLNGFVDPESELNPEMAGITDCHFEYVSEAGFEANDVNELQSVTLSGASGGTFALGLEGQSTAATGSGDLVGPAEGMGDLIEGVDAVVGLSTTKGEFVAGEEISGAGIPAGTTILSVQPGGLVLSAEATASGGVAVNAASNVITGVNTTTGTFAPGEEIAGAGIPAETMIAKVGPGKITLSADTTASGEVALSAALAHDASAGQVQSALASLASIGAGNVAVSGGAGGPYTVEFKGALADTAVAQLTGDSAGLTPAGASVASAIATEGGDGWGTAKSVPCEHPGAGEIPKGEAETPVHAVIPEHLQAGMGYRYRLAATVGGAKGGSADGAPVQFTVPAAPRVSATAASGVTSTFARLGADVDPLGSQTTYQFQYVSEEQFKRDGESWAGAAVAPAVPAAVGSGGEAGDLSEGVSQQVGGLAPATAYRFRLVAVNEAGTTEGEAGEKGEVAHTFTTQVAVAPGLPDGRAYELVTPPSKDGAQELFGRGTFLGSTEETGVSSESGDQFMFASLAAFGPFPATAGSIYVFSRHAVAGHPDREEWGYTSLASPALGVQGVGEDVGAVEPEDFSSVAFHDSYGEVGRGVGFTETALLGAPGGPYTTLHADQPFSKNEFARETTEVVGGSRDLGVVVLSSDNPALAEGGRCERDSCPSFVPDLYEWKGGELSRVDVKSDGEPVGSCGAMLGGGDMFGIHVPAQGVEAHDGAVSADGSKVFFTAPFLPSGAQANTEGLAGCPTEKGENPPELYMRFGEETVEVSAPEEEAPEYPKARHGAVFIRASEDGSRVFFTTEGELTKNDAGIHDLELYEYDTQTGTLTRISAGDSGDAAGGVVQFGFRADGGDKDNVGDIVVSGDGSHVYFVARGVLAPANAEGGAPVEGEENLYVYDTRTGRTAFVAASDGGVGYDAPEATSNGGFLLFADRGQLYRYDAGAEALACVTCTAGVSSVDLVVPSAMENSFQDPVLPVHAISEDGAYVFFNTTTGLVPQDTNGALDVYEWHEGKISLISSGQDPRPSYLLGASPDGGNVFFGTQSPLVAADSSGGGNVYDARICEPEAGNPCIAAAPAQEGLCEGDACSHPPAAPNDATPASLTFAGAGDLTPAPPTPPIAKKTCPGAKKLSAGRCVRARPKRRKTKRPKGGRARARGARSGKGGRRS
jgi:hypothetical protein